MQTVFTIRISCDPANADEVSNVAHRAVDYINESFVDADHIDPDTAAETAVAQVTLTRSGVSYVE